MKSLFDYIQESMFKNPLDALESYDIDATTDKLKNESTFKEGFDDLFEFINETFTKNIISEDDFTTLDSEKCYIMFLKNQQVDELEPAPFAINLYMGNIGKTLLLGGEQMEIDGTEAIPVFHKEIVDDCEPSKDIMKVKNLGMVEIKVYKISETLANLIYKNVEDIVKECGDAGGAATPANTMGAGDPVAPGPGMNDLGSGDTFQFNPRKPATKKEKKDKSKNQETVIDLAVRIEEELGMLGKKQPGDLARNMENEVHYDELKKVCYKLNADVFDENVYSKQYGTGYVRVGERGIEIFCPRSSKTVNSPKLGLQVSGPRTFIIRDSGRTKFNFQISKFRGDFEIIRNSNLKTLEGIFTEDCDFEGTLTIWHNKNLQSLKGLPKVLRVNPDDPAKSQNPAISIQDCPLIGIDEVKNLPQCPWVGWANNMPQSGLLAKHKLFKAIRRQTGCKNI